MPAHGPQPGDLVDGKYRLELLIGTGGMGAVWSAAVVDGESASGSGSKVAIKFLHAQMAADPLVVQRFLLEARAGMEIQHPNVVRLLGSGWIEGDESKEREAAPWIAMELLQGKTLSEVLRQRPRLDAVDAIALVVHVSAGAAAAHKAKIVHRDLKPANVFMKREGGTPTVLDFGISKFVDPNLDGGLTTTHAIVGSAMYMSPEQAMGGYKVDLRSDVWSLGILLYRVLTGESPLSTAGHQEIMVDLASPKELDLSALKNERIPPMAAAIVKRCLRKKREERFDSAVELEAELKIALDEAQQISGREPNLLGLLQPPTSDATLIAALPNGAGGGESTTAAVTAPTGVAFPAPLPPREKRSGEEGVVAITAMMMSPSASASSPSSTTTPRGAAPPQRSSLAKPIMIAGGIGASLALIVLIGVKLATTTTTPTPTPIAPAVTADLPPAAATTAAPVVAAPSPAPTEAPSAPPPAETAAEIPVDPPVAEPPSPSATPTQQPTRRHFSRPNTRTMGKGAGTGAGPENAGTQPWRRPGF